MVCVCIPYVYRWSLLLDTCLLYPGSVPCNVSLCSRLHLLLWATGSRHVGFSSYTSQALEPRLNGGGARASLPLITWNLPRPGVEPVSPAFTGRFFSAVSPGKFQEMVNFKAIEHPQENLHVSVRSNVTHNSKNVEGP